jgi:hypothetical protein
MKRRVFFLAILFLLPIFSSAPYNYSQEIQISNITCDLNHPCPHNLECYDFPEIGLRCAKPGPCTYYQCPGGSQCFILETYPAQVVCKEVIQSERDQNVTYDSVTSAVLRSIPEHKTEK